MDIIINNFLPILNAGLSVAIVWTFVVLHKDIIKEVNDVLVTYVEAVEDKKITEEEVKKLRKEFVDVINVVKALKKKDK